VAVPTSVGTYFTPGQLGVFSFHHATAIAEIKDGTSFTFLAGEKALDEANYTNGQDWGDDQMWAVGWDWDICRMVYNAAQVQATDSTYGAEYGTLWCGFRRDFDYAPFMLWGSAHPAGVNMALCDGSVRTMSFSTDLTTLLHLGDMADGYRIDAKSF
jgi:prepilin-type processing-associated H-X9-DG protein